MLSLQLTPKNYAKQKPCKLTTIQIGSENVNFAALSSFRNLSPKKSRKQKPQLNLCRSKRNAVKKYNQYFLRLSQTFPTFQQNTQKIF